MAGDEYYIFLCDNNKKILEEIYLGKMRYNMNKFALVKYQYEGHNGIYEIEERISDDAICYSILSMDIIAQIHDSLLDTPLSEGENKAYKDTKRTIEWIDYILKKYSEKYIFSSNIEPGTMHLLFYTIRD